jgi:hypothetical protein
VSTFWGSVQKRQMIYLLVQQQTIIEQVADMTVIYINAGWLQLMVFILYFLDHGFQRIALLYP